MVAPWETMDNASLGVATHKKNDSYHLQAPWNKNGNNRKNEEKLNSETVQARRLRRAENATRDRALKKMSSEQTQEKFEHGRKFKGREITDDTVVRRKAALDRDAAIKQAQQKNLCLVQQQKSEEKRQRLKAQSEIEQTVQRRKEVVAQRRQEAVDRHKTTEQEIILMRQDTSKYIAQRKQEGTEYRSKVAEEQHNKRVIRATLIREQRIQDERVSQELRQACTKRKQIRAAWQSAETVSEEKRDAPKTIPQESACWADEVQSVQRSLVKLNQEKKMAARMEHAWNRVQIETNMEIRHLNSLERKQVEAAQFYERNVAPLQRRSEFGKQRSHQEKLDRAERYSETQKQQQQNLERKAQIKLQDKQLQGQGILFG